MITTWDFIKDFYVQNYAVDPIVVEYIAVHDIVEMCCRGRSNDYIARALDFDVPYIESVLKEFLMFSGFKQDILFDTRDLYKRHKYNSYVFASRARELDPSLPRPTYRVIVHEINVLLDNMERMIDKYYAAQY